MTESIRPDPGPPDGLFVLVAGLALAAMLGPLAVALARHVVDAPGALYGVLLVASVGGVLVGSLTVRDRDGVAERLGQTRTAWLLVVAPLVLVTPVLIARHVRPAQVDSADLFLALLAGFGAASLGFVLVSMAKTRYTAWVLDDATEEAAWSAPWPAATRRVVWYVAGVTGAVGTGAFLLGAYLGIAPLRIAGQLLVPMAAVLATTGRTLSYRATDWGLEVRAPVARRAVPWSAFAGFRVSAETLLLVRPEPYRQSIRCDRSAMEDPDAVTAVLETHLDRLS